MSEIIIDAGTLHFNAEDLTATGLLVPYGVKARSNLGEFTVDPGVFEIPTDTTGSQLNVEHKRENVVGGLTRAWEQPEAGILAAFRFADTPEGRQAFADAKSGKRNRLSVEASGVRIQGGKAIAGRIFGAALVEKPAFDGATLLAAEDTPVSDFISVPEDGHLEARLEVMPVDITVTTPAGDSAVYEPTADPAEGTANQEGSGTLTASVQAAPAVVSTPVTSIPATLLASATAAAPAATPEEQAYELGTIFAAMSQLKGGINADDAQTLLAALSDITTTGLGGTAIQHSWVGQVWQGKSYTRKFIDLVTHGTQISLGGKKGFKLNQGTALVTAWAGNKTAIGSGTATTDVISSTLRKYGFAADVAREWYDLPGGAEIIEAFVRGVVDSYAKITDLDALNDIVKTAAWNGSGAWGSNVTGVIAPATYPSGYPAALGMIIQGISAVQDADDEPSFALVNAAAWNQLIYTPFEQIPEFIKFDFSVDGSGTADGKIVVRKAPASGFTLGSNVYTTNPAVVVGAKNAIEFDEIGETPVQLDALDIAKGGIDKAIVGYLQTFVVRPESLVLIGVKNS